MTVISARVKTMEYVLTEWTTTLVPAYLALKGKTAPSVSVKTTLINIIIYEVEFDRPGERSPE